MNSVWLFYSLTALAKERASLLVLTKGNAPSLMFPSISMFIDRYIVESSFKVISYRVVHYSILRYKVTAAYLW